MRVDLALGWQRQIFDTRHTGGANRLFRDGRNIGRRSGLNRRGLYLRRRGIDRLLARLNRLQHHFVDDLRRGLKQLR